MSILNEQVANILQLFSMPLETIGFGLVLVELYRPRLTVQLERWLTDLPATLAMLIPAKVNRLEAFNDKWSHWYVTGTHEESQIVCFAGGYVLGAIGGLVFLVANIVMGTFTTPILLYTVFGVIAFAVFGSIPLLMCAQAANDLTKKFCRVFIGTVTQLIHFLNWLSGGRTMGAIGLVLAFLGLIRETYQVAVLLGSTRPPVVNRRPYIRQPQIATMTDNN